MRQPWACLGFLIHEWDASWNTHSMSFVCSSSFSFVVSRTSRPFLVLLSKLKPQCSEMCLYSELNAGYRFVFLLAWSRQTIKRNQETLSWIRETWPVKVWWPPNGFSPCRQLILMFISDWRGIVKIFQGIKYAAYI